MNFLKWLAYFVAVFAFIWFVFFRPVGDKMTTTSETTRDTSPKPEEKNSEIEDFADLEIYDSDTVIIIDSQTNIAENEGELESDAYDIQQTPILEETTTTNETPIDVVSSNRVNLDENYLIVVGSFKVMNNAKNLLKTFEEMDFGGKITKINGLHRVVIASSNNEVVARQTLKEFTKNYQKPAFVLKQ